MEQLFSVKSRFHENSFKYQIKRWSARLRKNTFFLMDSGGHSLDIYSLSYLLS